MDLVHGRPYVAARSSIRNHVLVRWLDVDLSTAEKYVENCSIVIVTMEQEDVGTRILLSLEACYTILVVLDGS